MTDIFESIHNLLKQKKFDDVLELIVDADYSEIISPYNEDLNHAWYIVGDILYKNKMYEESIKCFKKSLEDWPEDIQAMQALANCYSDMKKSEDVIVWLQQALKIDSNNATLNYNYANALYDLGDYRQSIVYYKKIPESAGEIYWLSLKNIKRANNRV